MEMSIMILSKWLGLFDYFLCYGLGAPDPQLPLIFKSRLSSVTMRFRPCSSSAASSTRTLSVALPSQDLFGLCSSALNPTSPRCHRIPLTSHRSWADKDDRLCIPILAAGTLFDLKSHFEVLLKWLNVSVGGRNCFKHRCHLSCWE